MSVPDESAVDCMSLLARRNPKVVAGESAVAGLAALLLAGADPLSRAMLGLEEGSRVLVYGTEGATDPDLYARLTG